MARFAKIKADNTVETVVSVADSVITDSEGVQQEQLGVDFLNKIYKTDDTWKQIFTDGTKKNKGRVGYIYDSEKDDFYEPQPFPSWTLDEDTYQWEAPVAYPADGGINDKYYEWNEETQSWDVLP
mgnify:FL=1